MKPLSEKTLSEMTNKERQIWWEKERALGHVTTVFETRFKTRKRIDNGAEHIPGKNNLRGLVLHGVGTAKVNVAGGTVEFNLKGDKLKAEFFF